MQYFKLKEETEVKIDLMGPVGENVVGKITETKFCNRLNFGRLTITFLD